jgi:hypothetical protein
MDGIDDRAFPEITVDYRGVDPCDVARALSTSALRWQTLASGSFLVALEATLSPDGGWRGPIYRIVTELLDRVTAVMHRGYSSFYQYAAEAPALRSEDIHMILHRAASSASQAKLRLAA